MAVTRVTGVQIKDSTVEIADLSATGTPSASTFLRGDNTWNAPAIGGITGLGTGIATFLATPSSANLLAAITDETGTGALVFGTSPVFTTSLGINITPTVPLHVKGTATTSAVQFRVQNSSDLQPFTIQGNGNVNIGATSNPSDNSRLYVFGGANGANVDVRGLSGGSTDQAIIELEGNDYDSTVSSCFLMYRGSTATGTYMGFSNANLGVLQFNGSTSIIGTLNTDIIFAPNFAERARIKTDGTFVTNGTVGLTGSRVSKGWFTDLEVTNTITGNIASTNALKSATTTVNVSSATAPSSGQVLTATSSTAATWQSPAGGGNVSNVGTPVSGQIAEWTGATTIQGVAVTGSGAVVRTTSPTLVTPAVTTTETLTNNLAANTRGDGYILQNTGTASSGNQMFSPSVRFIGQGWKTNATAASQPVEFHMHAVPIQSAVNPAVQLKFGYVINGGSYTEIGYMSSLGPYFNFTGTINGTTVSGTTGTFTDLSSVNPITIGGSGVYYATGTDVAVTDGGTGRSTSTTAYGLIAAGTTATGAHQTLAAGATTEILVGGGASALPVWTTATGSGAPVRATSPILTTSMIAAGSTLTFLNTGTTPTDNDSVLSQSSSSPYRTLTILSKGGVGTWQGRINLDVAYNSGTAATGISVVDAGVGGPLVGIGTLSYGWLSERLNVKAISGITWAAAFTTNDFTNTVGSALFVGFGAASGNTYTKLQAVSSGYSANNHLVLQPSGSGYVGIQNTSPVAFLDVGASISTTMIKAGSIEIFESATLGNAYIGENSYYDGANLRARQTGAGGLLALAGGIIAGFSAPSVTAGSVQTYTRTFHSAADGKFGIGPNVTPSYPLQVQMDGISVAGTYEATALFIKGTGTSKGIALGYDTATQTGVIASYTASAASQLAFWTYDGSAWASRATIDSTGLNTRVVPRVFGTSSTATLTPEINTYDAFNISNQAANLTIANHSTSTPSNFETMKIRIKDNGTARTITFGTNYVSTATATLPTTTVISTMMEMLFEWNSSTSKWMLMSII